MLTVSRSIAVTITTGVPIRAVSEILAMYVDATKKGALSLTSSTVTVTGIVALLLILVSSLACKIGTYSLQHFTCCCYNGHHISLASIY